MLTLNNVFLGVWWWILNFHPFLEHLLCEGSSNRVEGKSAQCTGRTWPLILTLPPPVWLSLLSVTWLLWMSVFSWVAHLLREMHAESLHSTQKCPRVVWGLCSLARHHANTTSQLGKAGPLHLPADGLVRQSIPSSGSSASRKVFVKHGRPSAINVPVLLIWILI